MSVPGGTKINIAGTSPVLDPNYRYTMPAIYGRTEGKSKNKTILPNLSLVASKLHRDPGEILRYLGCELSTRTHHSGGSGSKSSNNNGQAPSISGRHTDGVLQTLMGRYIETFVLCPNCGLPETDYKIINTSRRHSIWHQCHACGARERIVEDHKVCKYILAQHRLAQQNKKQKNKNMKGATSDGEKKPNKKDRKKGRKTKSIDEATFGAKEDSNTTSSDNDTELDDDEAALQFAINKTQKYLTDHPNNNNASTKDIVEKVTNLQIACNLKTHDKIHILARAVLAIPHHQSFLREKKKIMETYGPAMVAIINGNKTMERHLIASLELLCSNKAPNNNKHYYFAVMIQQCYEHDILQEETILEWAAEDVWNEYSLVEDEETRTALRQQVEPFLVWLKEAEISEDEEEEESDSD